MIGIKEGLAVKALGPEALFSTPNTRAPGCEGQAPFIGLGLPGLGDSNSRVDGAMMSNLFWLTDAQRERMKPFFPKSHRKPRFERHNFHQSQWVDLARCAA